MTNSHGAPGDFPSYPFASADEQFRLLMESVTDYAIFLTDLERRVVTWNAGAERILGWAESEIVGQEALIIWTPQDRANGEAERELEKAAKEGRAEDERWHLRKDGSRFWASGILTALKDDVGNLRGYCKILRDLTERKHSEQRLRRLFDSQVVGVIFWNLESGLITDANDTFLTIVGYTRDDLAAGRLNFRAMTPPEWTERNEEGVATLRKDGSAPTYEKEYFRKDGSRVPILIGGTRFEDSGTEGFSYILDITERKQLERERERLLAETRAQADREALLNQISAEVRGALEPEAILQAVVNTLGQGLHADRCYFVRYDQARDTAKTSPEWIRSEAGIPPLSGRQFQMSSFSVNRNPAYKAGHTHFIDDIAIYDTENSESLQSLHLRSLMRVPIEVGNQMTALSVAMAEEPRHWTDDEIRLIENVAALVRSTLESAQVQQRERNIAQQLQEALQPISPPQLPGLALRGFYKSALEEAEVGGDFWDVFPLSDSRTALCCGDLSGKGLAAARQVATVRNMVRFALYEESESSEMTLANAINTLNRIILGHELLIGFATLFVGVYDHRDRTLTYVNCGQEPGLVWRASTEDVIQLVPTGSVLGGFDTGTFTQTTISLATGDTLALFTDGMTEVGPTRKDLLEIDGVRRLFQQCATEAPTRGNPQAIVDSLIAGVNAYGQGGVRDDIALLVGVVDPD